MAPKVKGGLGRGLESLFADTAPSAPSVEIKETAEASSKDSVKYISIHDIRPNENQPRKYFDPEKIDDLAKSINEHGVIQPIIVRKVEKGYEIVAGERRWRAAVKAGLTVVPTLVRELDDEENMLIAIIENMQREDLNPIEEAEGLNQMITVYKFTQEEVSKSVGKSRPYITNSLRLLKLPEYIREAVAGGTISSGHARTLIGVDPEKQEGIYKRIVSEGLSVRETEKLVNADGKNRKTKKKTKNADLLKVEAELKDALGTKVNILESGKKGKIEIEYYSKEELERLIDLLRSVK
ncbi:MAG: ParB/RepB/Spo0J family partition protein [Clostridia bacterium]|nr:ParB/RepB/Spo0J family partition protein [Clostridia bacterium]